MRLIYRAFGLMLLVGILGALAGCGPGTVALIDATPLVGVVRSPLMVWAQHLLAG